MRVKHGRTAAASPPGFEEDVEAEVVAAVTGGAAAAVRVSTSVLAMLRFASVSPAVYTAARP